MEPRTRLGRQECIRSPPSASAAAKSPYREGKTTMTIISVSERKF